MYLRPKGSILKGELVGESKEAKELTCKCSIKYNTNLPNLSTNLNALKETMKRELRKKSIVGSVEWQDNKKSLVLTMLSDRVKSVKLGSADCSVTQDTHPLPVVLSWRVDCSNEHLRESLILEATAILKDMKMRLEKSPTA